MAEMILPCPFCGSQPDEQDASMFVVECPSCGIHGPACDDAVHAIAAWNKRAQPSAARDMLAALVDVYDDGMNNPPESRTYVDGAFIQQMDEARAMLAAAETPKGE
jgi:Lar family restriction alleviation protein